jgi:hypothetical protein
VLTSDSGSKILYVSRATLKRMGFSPTMIREIGEEDVVTMNPYASNRPMFLYSLYRIDQIMRSMSIRPKPGAYNNCL